MFMHFVTNQPTIFLCIPLNEANLYFTDILCHTIDVAKSMRTIFVG